MKTYHMETQTLLNKPLEEAFPFFANAENLNKVTPKWLKFGILTPLPIEMKVGTIVEYRLRLHGAVIRWRSEITEWDPRRINLPMYRLKGPIASGSTSISSLRNRTEPR